MRNLRKAALAGATAVAVAFGTTSVALADDTATAQNSVNPDNQEGETTKAEGSRATEIGKRLEADQTAYGPALFGSSKGEADGEEEAFAQQPVWAKILYGLTIAASVAAALGLVVGPLYNFVVHGL